jgi:hypothetical protein
VKKKVTRPAIAQRAMGNRALFKTRHKLQKMGVQILLERAFTVTAFRLGGPAFRSL